MDKKTCLVTGATSGIGKEVAIGLVKSGAHVILVCRDPEKGKATQQELQNISDKNSVDLFIADLSSQQDIKRLSEQLYQKYHKLHVLINNAGVSLPNKAYSVDGIEMNLATNHLAPFLLSYLLVDLLKASGSSRIINISSVAHRFARADLNDIQFQQRKYRQMRAYAQSKLFLTMTSYEMARRFDKFQISVNSLHPGAINTKLLHKIAIDFFPRSLQKFIERPFVGLLNYIMTTPEQAAKPIIYLAVSEQAATISGKYYEKHKQKKSSATSYNTALTEKLWEVSEKLVGINE